MLACSCYRARVWYWVVVCACRACSAAAHTKLELFDKAVRDADMAVALNPMWGKGWWRKGTAQLEAGSYAAAFATFTAGLDKCPGDGNLLKGKRAARARVAAYNSAKGPGAAQAAAAGDAVPDGRTPASIGASGFNPTSSLSGMPSATAGSWAGGMPPGVLDSIPSTASVGVDSGNVRPPPVAGVPIPMGGAPGYGAAGVTGAALRAGAAPANSAADGTAAAGAAPTAATPAAAPPASAAGGAPAAAAAAEEAKAAEPAFPGTPEEEVARIQAAANYYVVLHASPSTSDAQLKKNYYTLARLLHPDKCNVPGADDAMKEVSLAYDTLSSPIKRPLYDQYMTERKPPPGADGEAGEQTYAEWEARQEPVQLPGWLVWLLSMRGVNWVVTGILFILLLPLVLLVLLVFLILYLLCWPYRWVLKHCFPEKFAQMRADAERNEARREEMEQDERYAHV